MRQPVYVPWITKEEIYKNDHEGVNKNNNAIETNYKRQIQSSKQKKNEKQKNNSHLWRWHLNQEHMWNHHHKWNIEIHFNFILTRRNQNFMQLEGMVGTYFLYFKPWYYRHCKYTTRSECSFFFISITQICFSIPFFSSLFALSKFSDFFSERFQVSIQIFHNQLNNSKKTLIYFSPSPPKKKIFPF